MRGNRNRFSAGTALAARKVERKETALRRRRRAERRLFRAGLVNELHLTISPIIFGGRTAPTLADGSGHLKLSEATPLQLKVLSADR